MPKANYNCHLQQASLLLNWNCGKCDQHYGDWSRTLFVACWLKNLPVYQCNTCIPFPLCLFMKKKTVIMFTVIPNKPFLVIATKIPHKWCFSRYFTLLLHFFLLSNLLILRTEIRDGSVSFPGPRARLFKTRLTITPD